MGILDEAIREHLDLMRQHGAASDEQLQQLEDEAFGPPARPGEEEPTGESAEIHGAPTVEEPVPAPPPAAHEEPTAMEHAIPGAEAEAEAPPEDEAGPEPAPEPEPEPPAAPEPPPQAAEETQAHPAPPEPPAAGIADQPTEIHNFEDEIEAEEDDFDVEEAFSERSLSEELDAALDDGPADEPDPTDESAQVEAPEPPPAPDPEPEQPRAPEPPPAAEPHEPEGQAEEGEDVLEETPDFLQDAPESDRLWFEQKPPKDFDFDE